MSNSSWVNTFRNTGPMVQRQALVERAQMPGLPGSQMFKGINQPIIDEFMSQSRSAAAAGIFNNPFNAPFGSAVQSQPAQSIPFQPSEFGQSILHAARKTPVQGSPEWEMRGYTDEDLPLPIYDQANEERKMLAWRGRVGEQGKKSFSIAGDPQIRSRWGYARNVAPSFAWNRAFMNNG